MKKPASIPQGSMDKVVTDRIEFQVWKILWLICDLKYTKCKYLEAFI